MPLVHLTQKYAHVKKRRLERVSQKFAWLYTLLSLHQIVPFPLTTSDPIICSSPFFTGCYLFDHSSLSDHLSVFSRCPFPLLVPRFLPFSMAVSFTRYLLLNFPVVSHSNPSFRILVVIRGAFHSPPVVTRSILNPFIYEEFFWRTRGYILYFSH